MRLTKNIWRISTDCLTIKIKSCIDEEMIARETKPAHQKILISLLLTTSEKSTQQGFIAELYLFFIRYLFLFEQSSNKNKSRVQKTSQLNAPQGNIYMGARYLDPKYSRWISVDPALGEYIPGAGKANARDAGGLPGMGGIFNSVNLSLFHYAGNNPIRYVDPDGRLPEDAVPLEGKKKDMVTNAQEKAISDIDKFMKKLQSFDGADLSFQKRIYDIVGYDISKENQLNIVKESVQKIGLSLSEMEPQDYKYDPRPKDYHVAAYVETKDGIVLYGSPIFKKTIYLTPVAFDEKELPSTLIHESAHKALNLSGRKEYYGLEQISRISASARKTNPDSWAILITGDK